MFNNDSLSKKTNNEIEHIRKIDKMNFVELFENVDIYTTRFNNQTYRENMRYKQNHDITGALYSTTLEFPNNTSFHKYLFVLEMNNDENRVMGISVLKNRLAKDQTIKLYSNPTFNNFIYKTSFHIPIVMKIYNGIPIFKIHGKFLSKKNLKKNLFYGKSNMKRGGSFTRFSKNSN